jgi:2-amino-4-hydroxy-6-hydroxymethyldihydropteridine diphosphokinase
LRDHTCDDVPVVIALGSNVGDSLQFIREAVERLGAILSVKSVSSAYRTAPMYVTDQAEFLNAVLMARTDLGPRSLLRALKEIECEVGRHKTLRYGPREIDLDLISYGSLSYCFEGGDKPLVVPHPKTVERRFVVLQLFEIAPAIKLVGLGNVADLLAQTIEQADDVQRIENAQL